MRYLDARGNLRRLADYDYTFRPAGPEHAVQQFVEATRIAGVRPESASLIHELASSHPRYASVRAALGPDEPAAEEPDDSMRWDPPLASTPSAPVRAACTTTTGPSWRAPPAACRPPTSSSTTPPGSVSWSSVPSAAASRPSTTSGW